MDGEHRIVRSPGAGVCDAVYSRHLRVRHRLPRHRQTADPPGGHSPMADGGARRPRRCVRCGSLPLHALLVRRCPVGGSQPGPGHSRYRAVPGRDRPRLGGGLRGLPPGDGTRRPQHLYLRPGRGPGARPLRHLCELPGNHRGPGTVRVLLHRRFCAGKRLGPTGSVARQYHRVPGR